MNERISRRGVLWLAALAALGGRPVARADERLEGIACRSVHLAYQAEHGLAFYNEVAVARSAAGSFFMVCGFGHGYFGLQELGDGRKVVIFSVWDPGQGDDPQAVRPEDRVVLIHKDEQVRTGRFGGEGTGGQSFFDLEWQPGQSYRFLVTARPDGRRTQFAAHLYLPEAKRWKHLVTFSTLSDGALLHGHYAFIEDFRRNRVSATEEREARFGPGWVLSPQGNWAPLTKARFTADANPVKNIDARVDGRQMLLATGGKTQPAHVPLGGQLELAAPAAAPPEDLESLVRDLPRRAAP
jgi:hypothetical protein